jgi:hypothetical protein
VTRRRYAHVHWKAVGTSRKTKVTRHTRIATAVCGYVTERSLTAVCLSVRAFQSPKQHIHFIFHKKQTPWALVRKRTIPTERPPLVDEILCHLLRTEGCRVVSAADPPGRQSQFSIP